MSNSNIGNKQPSLRKPVVLMTMGSQERKGHDYQVMTHKYITPLVEFSDCVPVLVPTCCGTEDLDTYLDMADGVPDRRRQQHRPGPVRPGRTKPQAKARTRTATCSISRW